MKIVTTALLLVLPLSLFSQERVSGRYRDYFGSRLYLNADGTFKYTWSFDMASSWTKGTWMLRGDTVYLNMVPTYDTVSISKPNGRAVDSLMLSEDDVSERLTQLQLAGMLLSGGGQNRQTHPDKLVLKKGRLYKIQNGRIVKKKQKGFWSSKKWQPWYFKSNE
jgi:hypothetical protein